MTNHRQSAEADNDDPRPAAWGLVLHMSAGPLVVLALSSCAMGPMVVAALGADDSGGHEGLATVACASVFFFWPALAWAAVTVARSARWLREGRRLAFVVSGLISPVTLRGFRAQQQGCRVTLECPERTGEVFVAKGWGWAPRLGDRVYGTPSPTEPEYVMLEPLRRVVRM